MGLRAKEDSKGGVKWEGRRLEYCIWQIRHWEGNPFIRSAFNQLEAGRIQRIRRGGFKSGKKSFLINEEESSIPTLKRGSGMVETFKYNMTFE